MQLQSNFSSWALALLAIAMGPAPARAASLLSSGVEVAASKERTALVRATGNLSSTVDVKLKNTGDRPLLPPLHAAITFTPLHGGNLAGLAMPDAQSGIGQAPYQTFFKDLSAAIGSGLAAGTETTFSFTFERPQDAQMSYAIAIYGNRNQDPNAVIDGPNSGQQGVAVPFDASASSDPDGDALTFGWDFGDGQTASDPSAQHAFASSGLFTVTVTVTDARGAVVARETQVPIAPAGVFALARTRTLDGNGHPLGEVTVLQSGAGGEQSLRSDAVSGFCSLGGVPGGHSWRFSRAGYLTSYRKTTLTQGQVKVVAFPWLAALNPNRTPLSLLNPTVVKAPSERVALTLPPDAFEQVEAVAITELHGQTLPLPLPFGWSPLAAFHVALPGAAAADVAASLQLVQEVAAAVPLALVRLDEDALGWRTEALLSGSGSNTVAAVLRQPGSYAVVLADTLPAGNPAAAVPGEVLPAGEAPSIAEVTAVGAVNPGRRVASLDPARVTAAATVDFTNGAQALASGSWFLAEVEETYDLNDGRALKTPDYDATFYAYQNPGDASPATATATFPLRPRILFGPDQLTEAHIKVAVRAANQFSGGIVTPEGALLSLAGVQLGVPAGAVSSAAAAEIRLLDTANLTRFLGGFEALMAFDLNLPRLAEGSALSLSISRKLAPDARFVLARCVGTGSESGLQPVLRLRSDAQGSVISEEPTTGPKLPGITGSGQYVIVQIPAAEALITGLVRQPGGALLPSALVRVAAEPWLSLTSESGAFFTLAKPGERSVSGTDSADGNSGQATATLADAAAIANIEIQTAATGPRVLVTTPSANDAKASIVTPISVEFSEAIQPGSFGATGVRLRDVAADSDVAGSLSLDLTNRKATLLPLNPLNHGAAYEILVSSAILDRQGLPIEGTLSFSFTSAPSAERPAGAQLVIYEPGAANVPANVLSQLVGYQSGEGSSDVVAHGSAGTADPEVPVILVNESSGETATVLSKADGSFANFIRAAADDFVMAVFVNGNGTRVEVPATRQLFDDGRVGLYRQGGILEASNDEAGRVEVIVKPGSVPSRSIFKLDVLSLAAALGKLAGLEPAGEAAVVGGIELASTGDEVGEMEVKVSVPFADLGIADLAELENQMVVLVTPEEVDGVRVFATRALPTAPPEVAVPASLVRGAQGFQVAGNSKAAGLMDVSTPQVSDAGSASGDSASFAYTVPGSPQGFNSLLRLSGRLNLAVTGSVSAEAGRGLVEAAGQLRVPGAFVFPSPLDVGGNPLVGADGQVIIKGPGAGEIGALTSPQNGGFSMAVRVPNGQSTPIFLAVSTLFPGQIAMERSQIVAADGVLSQVARTVFPRFTAPDLAIESDRTGPRIFSAFSPTKPAALGNFSPFKLLVTATDDESVMAPTVTVSLVEVEPVDPADNGRPRDELVTSASLGQTAIGNRLEETWQLNAFVPARLSFEVIAKDSSGNVTLIRTVIDVDRSLLLDVAGAGPLVVGTFPQDQAVGVMRGEPVLVRFSEPMNPATLAHLDTMFSLPVMDAFLQDQNRELVVRLDSSNAAGPVRVDLSPLLENVGGAPLDQDPTTQRHESHHFSFEYSSASLVGYGLRQGGGVVGDALHQFALEREVSATGEATLQVFKTAAGEALETVAKVALPPYPRDLLLLGRYHFHHPIAGVMSANLLAVVGGLAGIGQDSWLRIYDVSDPAKPFELVATQLGLGGATLPVKLAWSPPRLGVLLLGGEQSSVLELDLQLLIRAQNLADYSTEPAAGDPGQDLNEDGDYVDAGEILPRPMGAGPVVGVINGGAVATNVLTAADAVKYRFNDFDMGVGGRLMVACGRSLDPTRSHRFWILKAPGMVLNDDESAISEFLLGAEPARVKLLVNQRVDIAQPEGGFLPGIRDLAVVSRLDGKLSILDLTDRRRLAVFNILEIPQTDGLPKSITVGADGLLYLACAENMLVLDPQRLGPSTPASTDAVGAFKRAYVHRLRGLGTGARAFMAADINHVASSLATKSFYFGDALPPTPVQVGKLELVQFYEKKPALLNQALSLEEVKVRKRVSQDGVLEIVDPTAKLSGEGRFNPLIKGIVTPQPSDAPLPRSFPTWKIKRHGASGFEEIGKGYLEREIAGIPGYSAAKELPIQLAPPLADIALLLASGSSLGVEKHLITAGDKQAELRVFSGVKLDSKIDTKNVTQRKFGPVERGFNTLVGKLPGKPEIKLESKGFIGYKAEWREHPDAAVANFAFATSFGCDPLFGVKAEFGIPPPIPPPVNLFVVPILEAAGVKFFVALNGQFSLAGTVARNEKAAYTGSVEVGGKVTVGAGAKVAANSLIQELSLTGETGLGLKAKLEGDLQGAGGVTIKSPTLTFEGLAVKTALKLNVGNISFSKKITVLEPEELARMPDVPLFE